MPRTNVAELREMSSLAAWARRRRLNLVLRFASNCHQQAQEGLAYDAQIRVSGESAKEAMAAITDTVRAFDIDPLAGQRHPALRAYKPSFEFSEDVCAG